MAEQKPALMMNGHSVAFMWAVVAPMRLRRATDAPNESTYQFILRVLEKPDTISSTADLRVFCEWVLECQARLTDWERWHLHDLFPSLSWLALAA